MGGPASTDDELGRGSGGGGGNPRGTDFGDATLGGYATEFGEFPGATPPPFAPPAPGGPSGPTHGGGYYGQPPGSTSGPSSAADDILPPEDDDEPLLILGPLLYTNPVPDMDLDASRGGIDAGFEVDVIDESTAVTIAGEYIITGNSLSSMMVDGVLDSFQVTREFPSPGGGWDTYQATDELKISLASAASVAHAGIYIGYEKMNSVFTDPDNDVTVTQTGIKQYYHTGTSRPGGISESGAVYFLGGKVRDPELKDSATAYTMTDGIANNAYAGDHEYEDGGGVYSYDQSEMKALFDKYGYTVTPEGTYPKDTYGASYQRISDDLEELINRLQAGVTQRKDITRSTSRTNIFDNFEKITDSEVAENILQETFGVEEGSIASTTMQMPDSSDSTGEGGGGMGEGGYS